MPTLIASALLINFFDRVFVGSDQCRHFREISNRPYRVFILLATWLAALLDRSCGLFMAATLPHPELPGPF